MSKMSGVVEIMFYDGRTITVKLKKADPDFLIVEDRYGTNFKYPLNEIKNVEFRKNFVKK